MNSYLNNSEIDKIIKNISEYIVTASRRLSVLFVFNDIGVRISNIRNSPHIIIPKVKKDKN